MYALIDCANFFVSCERVFNPSLEGIPVIVIGNNDGCAIARSEEAKALGIPMGVPLFKVKDIVKQHRVKTLSVNMSLYADLSRRVMETIYTLAEEVEPYSIDECFVKLPSSIDPQDYINWGVEIRQRILQWVGIPTRVGIGPTKTLAKVANKCAKRDPLQVCYVNHQDQALLSQIEVKDIWGVGRKTAEKLNCYGVYTARDMSRMNDAFIRKLLTINGLKTVHELRGYPVHTLHTQPDSQKSMIVSRSFGQEVKDKDDINKSISFFCHKAGEALRRKKLWASYSGVMLQTNQFKEKDYYTSHIIPLPYKTQDTQVILQACIKLIHSLFIPGKAYKKAGIFLEGLSDHPSTPQLSFDLPSLQGKEQDNIKLMRAIDHLNKKMGAQTITFGPNSKKAQWIHVQSNRSPSYTRSWKDLVRVT